MTIDCHSHLTPRWDREDWQEQDDRLMGAADALAIDVLMCSIVTAGRRPCEPAYFRQANDWTKEGMDRYPGRVLGYCHVNCGYGRESIAEIQRCVGDLGFVGVKLYNDYFLDEPVICPIVELCIEMGIPILMHAGYLHHPLPTQPRISGAERIAALSRRYPEAVLICGHVGGGGDWEWAIRAARAGSPSMYLDTSGSVVDDGMIEMAVRTVGVERLLFGCDLSLCGGIGKIRGAALPEYIKKRILGENMQGILARRVRAT